MMHTYDVIFYRRLPNSYGHEFPVVLASYRIGDCQAGQEALDAATGRFVKQMKIGNWRDLAHEVTVDTVA
jgi:hypothetical protein